MKRFLITGILLCISLNLFPQTSEMMLSSYPNTQDVKMIERIIDALFEASTNNSNISPERDILQFLRSKKKSRDIPIIIEYIIQKSGPEWKNTEYFINPVDLCAEFDDEVTFKELLKLDKKLLNESEKTYSGYYNSPFANCVVNDNTKWMKILIDAGVNPLKAYWNVRGASEWPQNLLSFAKSGEAKEILISSGIEQYYQYTDPINGICIDSSVRIRDKPNINSKILGKSDKDDEVKIIGVTYFDEVIDGKKGRWIKIKNAQITGWSFECFFLVKFPERAE